MQRAQLAVGFLIAIARYYWIVKEDRSKDKTVFLPLAGFFVIFFTCIKMLTFHLTPLYFLCRDATEVYLLFIFSLILLQNIIFLGEGLRLNTSPWKMDLGTFLNNGRRTSLTSPKKLTY